MSRSSIEFSFMPAVEMPEVEATMRLALLAVESLHGADRVQLETNIRIDRGKRSCVVDTTTEVGRTLSAIFSGYVRREFGEEAIGIQAMAGMCDPAGSVA